MPRRGILCIGAVIAGALSVVPRLNPSDLHARGTEAALYECFADMGAFGMYCSGHENGGQGAWIHSHGYKKLMDDEHYGICVSPGGSTADAATYGLNLMLCRAYSDSVLTGVTGPGDNGSFREACGGGQVLAGAPWEPDT